MLYENKEKFKEGCKDEHNLIEQLGKIELADEIDE
jgi:hypothetical protein